MNDGLEQRVTQGVDNLWNINETLQKILTQIEALNDKLEKFRVMANDRR
jgi:hypothetical protein